MLRATETTNATASTGRSSYERGQCDVADLLARRRRLRRNRILTGSALGASRA